MADRNAIVRGPYLQPSIRARIEAFFLDNLGKIVTREQLLEVATDPETGRIPENWHQRLSELRTDGGYTILSWRNRGDLRMSEYMTPNAERRAAATRRTRPTAATWKRVLSSHGYRLRGRRAASVAASATETSIPWEAEPPNSRLITELLMRCTQIPIPATRPNGDRFAGVIKL